jgi:cephalosporin hydroxylase
MPGDAFPFSTQAVSHYAEKARVCRDCKPARVIEIGTRSGYSLAAFHAVSPGSRFLCIDAASDADSAACLHHWQRVADSLAIDAQLVVANSHDIKRLPPADFAHVDGDHSHPGALADLRLVSHVPVILADDYCNPDVARAVQEFCAETGRDARVFHDGLRKAAVLVEVR